MAMSSNDRELIQQLLEDLSVLDPLLIGVPIPKFVRTIFAPIMRRWIAEGDIYKAQKLIFPHILKFSIYSEPDNIKLCSAGMYDHWMGMMFLGTFGVGGKLPSERGKISGPFPHHSPVATEQKASSFINQKMFFWKDEFYTRCDVIKMHANKLGGIHLDFKRKETESHINELKNYFGYEIENNNFQMLVGDEIEKRRADTSRRDRVYDAVELVTYDTGRIFAQGIHAYYSTFKSLLS